MGFKEAINEYGKQITASFDYLGVTYRDEPIISMNPHYEGSLLKTVMKCLDIELDVELIENESSNVSTYNVRTSNARASNASTAIVGAAIVGASIAGTTVASGAVSGTTESTGADTIENPKFGVKGTGDSDYSYIQYGTYIIKSTKKDEESHSISLECYDLMLESMIPYDIALDYSQGVTVKDLLDAICNRLGWSKGYTTFYNSDVLIDEEKYDISDTFRDVLDDIAEVAGGMIGFIGDALTVIYPTNSGEVIDEENLKSLTIGKKYGPINSVVLSRTPQEDNIYRQDKISIAENGLTEIRIENNQIIDTHREDFMDGICAALFGLSFELYELESFGIGYLNFGDFFAIKTADGAEHKALMLCDDLQITQGVTETSKLPELEVTNTDYSAASETDKALKKAILRVDKQNGLISALVEKTNTLESGLGTVTTKAEAIIDEESINLKISEAIEGIDSIETSTGYRFDKDGLNIHKSGEEMHNTLNNLGMYVRKNAEDILVADADGVNAINLTARKYLIVGDNARFENYTNGTDSKRTACFYIGG